MAPRRGDDVRRRWLIVGSVVVGAAALLLLAIVVLPELLPGAGGPDGTPAAAGCVIPADGRPSGPPEVTPLPDPPATPVSDGTTATIETEVGNIVIELYCGSAPVAAQNFVNLAAAGFYEGVGFHRIIPDFMIQGGDPQGTGAGGPGYTIPDEEIVGDYARGTVAMARTPLPNSQGSQFFIVVADSPHLQGGGYTIFGRVTSGMEVADEIVSGERSGPQNDVAVDPVLIERVTLQRP